MNRILKISAIAAVIATCASCGSMDLTPGGSIVYTPGDQIITNSSDLDGFEAGVIASFRGIVGGNFDRVSDIATDYFNAGSHFGNNYGDIHRMTFLASDYDTEDIWESCYGAIKNFNIFIDGAQSVPEDLKERAAVARGEAYIGRAYAYLTLTRYFGKAYNASTASTDLAVPLVLHYDQSERPARETVANCYTQIKKDLDSAAFLLSSVAGNPRAEKPTIDAVDAMYARYYLDVKDYANAAASAMKLIDGGKYALASTADALVGEWTKDNGTESILQFYASNQEGGYASDGYYYGSQSKDPEKGLYYSHYYVPCKKLVEAYDADDIRFAAWFDNTLPAKLQSWHNLDGAKDFYMLSKYVGNLGYGTSEVPQGRTAKKPFMISEMYLIAAEAYIAGNATDKATAVLNELQTKRGATLTAASTATVQKEWYREMVGQGHRFLCLKRWGEGISGRAPQAGAAIDVMKGSDYIDMDLKSSDFHFVLPVPTYELKVNGNLVQNEGYANVEVE